jgi:hypothetical protein
VRLQQSVLECGVYRSVGCGGESTVKGGARLPQSHGNRVAKLSNPVVIMEIV